VATLHAHATEFVDHHLVDHDPGFVLLGTRRWGQPDAAAGTVTAVFGGPTE
jgi:hypothetical protein